MDSGPRAWCEKCGSTSRDQHLKRSRGEVLCFEPFHDEPPDDTIGEWPNDRPRCPHCRGDDEDGRGTNATTGRVCPHVWHDRTPAQRARHRGQVEHCEQRESELINDASMSREFDPQVAAIEMLNADLWTMTRFLLERDE